jgi:hypothetical protein
MVSTEYRMPTIIAVAVIMLKHKMKGLIKYHSLRIEI